MRTNLILGAAAITLAASFGAAAPASADHMHRGYGRHMGAHQHQAMRGYHHGYRRAAYAAAGVAAAGYGYAQQPSYGYAPQSYGYAQPSYGYAAQPQTYGPPHTWGQTYAVPTTVYRQEARTQYVPETTYRPVTTVHTVPTIAYRQFRKQCTCETVEVGGHQPALYKPYDAPIDANYGSAVRGYATVGYGHGGYGGGYGYQPAYNRPY